MITDTQVRDAVALRQRVYDEMDKQGGIHVAYQSSAADAITAALLQVEAMEELAAAISPTHALAKTVLPG